MATVRLFGWVVSSPSSSPSFGALRGAALVGLAALGAACATSTPPAGAPASAGAAGGQSVAAAPAAAQPAQTLDVELRGSSSFALSPDEVITMAGPGPGTQSRASIDKEVVRRVIRSHIEDVKECHEPVLARNPLLGGFVRVDFTI